MAWTHPHRKKEIARRDGGYRCAYCGETGTRQSLTVDHIVPRSKGGTGIRANLVLACESCNREKADSLGWVPKFILRRYADD